MSTKEREDVDFEEAKKVWDLYKANIPELEKVEIHPTPTPVKAVFGMIMLRIIPNRYLTL
jgi:hypothetical protein